MRKGKKIRFWTAYVPCIDKEAPVILNKRGKIVAYVVCDPKTGKKRTNKN